MSDTYQAIYDSVRSRISGCNVGEAIRDVVRECFDISHSQAMIRDQLMIAASDMSRPSVLFKPSIGMDGSKWCALYGDDLMRGVAGFGDTPDQAMLDFDLNWYRQRTQFAVTEEDSKLAKLVAP